MENFGATVRATDAVFYEEIKMNVNQNKKNELLFSEATEKGLQF